MCGIAGILDLSLAGFAQDAEDKVRAMTTALVHRGPDGAGIWRNGPVCLGHRRLSIIDLDGGAQPMLSGDGQLAVTFNGEIYNFLDLRKELEKTGARFASNSDTEIILAAYRQWGTDCLAHFDGMFSFALWDAARQRLFCARDRFGKKPFFYTIQNGKLYFASELTALKTVPDLVFQPDPKAVARYLAYEYVPTPQTMYSKVFSLEPSCILLLENAQAMVLRYWDLPYPDEGDRRGESELCEELLGLMRRAVARRMISDVPLGVFLSGGIDSTIVAGLMAQLSSRPVRTFSIGFTEASYDESRYARIAATAFGTEHSEQVLSAAECAEILPDIISRMDVPMADASVAPTWLLSRLARRSVTVALGGDGADELWAGYEHFVAFRFAQCYERLPDFLRKFFLEPIGHNLPGSGGYINMRLAAEQFLNAVRQPAWLRIQSLLTAFAPALLARLLTDDWLDMLRQSWTSSQEECSGIDGLPADKVWLGKVFAPTFRQFNHWQPASAATDLARCFHVYARQFLLDDILVKVDRCSMLHSLEVRAPFLDRDVVEFVARLPMRHKLHFGFARKYLLKKAFSGLLPRQILNRNKRGFQIPVADWLRGRLLPLVQEMLGASNLRRQGIFRPEAVNALVEAHVSGREDLRKQLWALLVFQLWWRAAGL